jgi:hypothetical protein
MLVMTLTACGNGAIPRVITVDQEVSFPAINREPNSIIRTRDGGLLVSGTLRTGWALATTSQGEVLWQYQDPLTEGGDNPRVPMRPQSEFHGVVPLENGNFLFCGSRSTSGHEVNEITILDAKGHLVERRSEIPNQAPMFDSSGFGRCVPWDGGIAVLGFADGSARTAESTNVFCGKCYVWVMKLNNDGVKLWESFYDRLAIRKNAEMTEANFVNVNLTNDLLGEIVTRETPKGEVIARREIKPGGHFVQLRSGGPMNTTQLISYGLGGRPMLYTLDDRLADAVKPIEIPDFDATQGCGYVLPDKSVVLFGRRSNAALAWISSTGQLLATSEFSLKHKSYVIKDAVPISANQFVTVRYSVSLDASDRGLIMDWITLK